MKLLCFLAGLILACPAILSAQANRASDRTKREVATLIAQYAQARDSKDTTLLKQILTDDIDQLVSTGEWRSGIRAAVEGMMASSVSNPGNRTLAVDKIKLISPHSLIVDCRYEIKNPDGTVRRMWSSFILVADKGTWKISAIRNMLPTGQ